MQNLRRRVIGIAVYLEVQPDNVTLEWDGSDSKTFVVNSNVDWDI